MSENVPVEVSTNPLSQDDLKYLESHFMYHSPKEDQPKRYELIRGKAKELAEMFFRFCPPCADRTAALRCLREAVMTANAAIAINE